MKIKKVKIIDSLVDMSKNGYDISEIEDVVGMARLIVEKKN